MSHFLTCSVYKLATHVAVKNNIYNMFKNITLTFAFALVVMGAQAPSANAQSIVDIAVSDSNFSSLVDAVVSQDLASTLDGPGSFTVFAPTNDAFSDLPGYVGDAIAKDGSLLTDILLYHVAGEELFSGDVLAKKNIKTLQGEKVRVSSNDDGAFVNSSELVALDIDADNGVVHVIDRVLLPKSVYKAVIENLRHEIMEIRDKMQDVRGDSRMEKYPS